MNDRTTFFYHPLAFWTGCVFITAGVLAHLPMFIECADMGYRMAGMPMSNTMLTGMALIPLGLVLAWYGVKSPADLSHQGSHSAIHFHVADHMPLNSRHWSLVLALFAAVAVDVMKPATLGFVMPGMSSEYQITRETAGYLALVALTGTALGSVIWGQVADRMGRRPAILLSALMFIGTAICGAMPAFEWNLARCFLMGLSAGGLLPITFTLMAEMIPVAHRGWLLVALGGVGTAAGYLLASGSAALLEPLFSWRILWLLGLPTGLVIVFLNRFIPESPRYLSNAGLHREARAVLSRYNGELGNDTDDPLPDIAHIDAHSFFQMLRGPYAGITLGLVGTGLAWGLVNFGFLLWLPTNLRAMGISGNAANTLLTQSGLLALPGVIAVVALYHYWSSIKTLVLFIAISACSLLGYFVLHKLHIDSTISMVIITALLLVGTSGVIAMLIPYAAEIYPVALRGTGAGVVAASSKAGGVLGAICGVLGVFNDLSMSAALIAIPLGLFGFLLLQRGIDTRGKRLEAIHHAVVNKSAR